MRQVHTYIVAGYLIGIAIVTYVTITITIINI